MVGVGAPKKVLTERTRSQLEVAVAARNAADAELWARCDEALREGSYEEVAAVVGVAKSTLQEKVRLLRDNR